MDLGVTGAVNGNLYITGQPAFDAATQTLSFEQFDYTVDTKSVLVHTGDRLFHEDLLFRLKPQTEIDLSDRIDALRQQLSGKLTRELISGTWLESTVTNLHPRRIHPVAGGVEILLVADGFLQLAVR